MEVCCLTQEESTKQIIFQEFLTFIEQSTHL